MTLKENEAGFSKLALIRQFDEIRRAYDTFIEGSCEKEFLQFALHFEECRKKWSRAEIKCMELQEKVTKCEAEKNALMIKLKHARRQIEVELQGRQKAEQDRDELDNQIMLVRELLLSDGASTATLSEEQQRKLDFLNSSRFQSPRGGARTHRRLDRIDETESMLSDYSDISFDVTEDDLDASNLRNGKRWKRGRMAARRAFGDGDDDEILPKRVKANVGEALQCTVEGPATMRIEKLEKSFSKPNPHQGRRRPSREHRRRSAATSDSEAQSSEIEAFWPKIPVPKPSNENVVGKRHNLQMKP
uniref:Uncharacterized protein n=1 Tax=Ciona savignyi TaxID=51511 RepID=H2ZDZ6_CIOSA